MKLLRAFADGFGEGIKPFIPAGKLLLATIPAALAIMGLGAIMIVGALDLGDSQNMLMLAGEAIVFIGGLMVAGASVRACWLMFRTWLEGTQ